MPACLPACLPASHTTPNSDCCGDGNNDDDDDVSLARSRSVGRVSSQGSADSATIGVNEEEKIKKVESKLSRDIPATGKNVRR